MANVSPSLISIHIPQALQKHTIPLTAFLQAHPQYNNLAIGAFIFHPPLSFLFAPCPGPSSISEWRLLLVQRAASEPAFPHLWEVPGGQSDDADPTILHSVARETFEETGLRLTRFVREIGKGVEFESRKKRWVKLNFEVEVQELWSYSGSGGHVIEPEQGVVDRERVHSRGGEGAGASVPGHQDIVVTVDPQEHQKYKWATEEEIRDMAGQIVTTEQFDVMMRAFALKKLDWERVTDTGK